MTHGSLTDYTLPAPAPADDDGAPRAVALIGSTGSIGTQGLDVIAQDPARLRAVALAGGANTTLLAEQAVRFEVEAVGSAAAGEEELRAALADAAARLGRPSPRPVLFTGPCAAEQIAAWPGADTVLNGITGSIGLRPTLAALHAGHRLALANKESLVAGGELVTAAASIEEELRTFESLAEEVRTGPLRAQKHLEKMGKLLTSVADCDERLVAHMRTLLGVLNGWRDRQQALAAEVNQRAQELQERTRQYQALMERFAGLGQEAGALSASMQGLAKTTQGGEAMKPEALIQSLQGVNEKMAQVAERARELSQDAQAQDFADISRDAESLRQQLLAALNRAHLLQQKLHPASA